MSPEKPPGAPRAGHRRYDPFQGQDPAARDTKGRPAGYQPGRKRPSAKDKKALAEWKERRQIARAIVWGRA